MAITDWSKTAGQNTLIDGIDIGEGCSPANLNNALRSIMASSRAGYDNTAAVLATGTVAAAVGTRIYLTQAALYADLVPTDGQLALVVADAVPSKNDLYRKTGATTVGSWSAPLGIFSNTAAALVQPIADAASASASAAATSAASVSTLINRFAPASISANLFDQSTVTAEAIVDAAGTISASALYQLSALIPVLPSTTYTLLRDENYNEYNGSITRTATHLQAGFAALTFTTGATTRYIRFNVENSYSGSAYTAFMMAVGTTLPASFVAYSLGYAIPLLAFAPGSAGAVVAARTTPLAGKKWVAIGDSITEGTSYGGVTTYAQVAAAALGAATLVNAGVGGSSIVRRSAFDALYPPLVARISTQPADADLITVMMGVNDISYSLGLSSSQNEFEINGALNSALSQLCARYPTQRILFFTPLPYSALSGTSPYNIPADPFTPSTRAVADAIIERCQRWSVPCFDLHRAAPFLNWNATAQTAYIPDGLHPNTAGHARVAPLVERAIRSMFEG